MAAKPKLVSDPLQKTFANPWSIRSFHRIFTPLPRLLGRSILPFPTEVWLSRKTCLGQWNVEEGQCASSETKLQEFWLVTALSVVE